MLYLGPEDVGGLITMEEAVAAVESGYRGLAQNPVLGAARTRIHSGGGVRVSTHPGGNDEQGVIGVMVHAEAIRVAGDVQHVAGRSPLIYLLFDAEDGRLLAMVAAEVRLPELGVAGRNVFRPAAVSGVGVRCLARPESRTAALLGSGGQARHHLWMLRRLLPLERARVYSPDAGHRADFAREMSALLGIEVSAADRPEDAVRGADVVVAATNANRPALKGEWLEPGQHVISIVGSDRGLVASGRASEPRRELDDEVIRRADRIVVNDRGAVLKDEQADLCEPIRLGILRPEQLDELADVVGGRLPGRSSDQEITLHKNNAGSGVADISLAAVLYRRAVELGRGRRLD